jgi:hypothetical protein
MKFISIFSEVFYDQVIQMGYAISLPPHRKKLRKPKKNSSIPKEAYIL